MPYYNTSFSEWVYVWQIYFTLLNCPQTRNSQCLVLKTITIIKTYLYCEKYIYFVFYSFAVDCAWIILVIDRTVKKRTVLSVILFNWSIFSRTQYILGCFFLCIALTVTIDKSTAFITFKYILKRNSKYCIKKKHTYIFFNEWLALWTLQIITCFYI